MIRMTGAEFKRFYDDTSVWPEDSYWEDGLILVDGREDVPDLAAISDTATVEVHGGDIYSGHPHVPADLQAAITWWRERQATVECIVRVPKDQLGAFRAAMDALRIEFTQVQ